MPASREVSRLLGLLRGDTEIPGAKAASGGELSRLLLAIQVSLPPQLIAPTVVFDEVEAGLGGRAAYLTGLKLRDLSTHVQVILITHDRGTDPFVREELQK